MSEKLLLRIEEAAEVLQLGRNRVYELAASGQIPSLRIGRTLRIPADALRAWIAEQTTGAGAPR